MQKWLEIFEIFAKKIKNFRIFFLRTISARKIVRGGDCRLDICPYSRLIYRPLMERWPSGLRRRS